MLAVSMLMEVPILEFAGQVIVPEWWWWDIPAQDAQDAQDGPHLNSIFFRGHNAATSREEKEVCIN